MPHDQLRAGAFPEQDVSESLIAEPLCVRIGLDRNVMAAVTHASVSADISSASLPPETRRIVDTLKLICEAKSEQTIMLYGIRHKFRPLKMGKGTKRAFRENCTYGAEILVTPDGRERQQIHVEYYVMQNVWNPKEPAFYLECEGNPTTIMTGNNLRSVTIRDPKTGMKERYPSSSPQVLTLVNRSPFHFLEAVAQAFAPSNSGLFSAETQAAIANGDFRGSHVQWACYFAAPAAPFLKILTTMFGTFSATKEGVLNLAECMGLEFESKRDKRTGRVKSVLLIKRQGNDIAWSVDFYDKRARVSQTKHGRTLGPDDATLIDTHVRIDVTAQYRAILQIIGAARSFLKKHGALFSQLPDAKFADEFLALEIKPTVRQLEFAVFVLSHRVVGGRLIRGSFADWLIPIVLGKIIPLRRIVAFTAAGLRTMERSEDPVAVAWQKAKGLNVRNWERSLRLATKFKKSKIYNDRKKFWQLNNIDIAIAYAFYHRLQFHPSITLMTEEDREALIKASDQRDGEAIMRLLDASGARFFTQMKTLVAEPILKPPVLLTTKALGEVEPTLANSPKTLENGEAAAETTRVPVKSVRRSPYRLRWMVEGIDSRSSFLDLVKAKAVARQQLAAATSTADRKLLRRRLAWLAELRNKKLVSIKKAKRTRRLRKFERPMRSLLRLTNRRPEHTNEK
jgi:hypothetical protein